ncbi:MAG: hypothetical protein K2Q07_05070 [Burkholderiaceae bacterium]|nr:hypothetical protein [Burkholderiaceae bacterium]
MSDTPPASIGVPAAKPAVAADALCGVVERLQQSRQLMRVQMLELNAASAQPRGESNDRFRLDDRLVALSALPVLGPLISDAARWWSDHPLRAVADLFTRPSGSTTGTLTQRHPRAWALSAAAAGALLMWTRPWRFAVLRRAVYSGLLPQVVSTLVSQVPIERLIDFAQSVWRRPTPDESPPGSADLAQPHGRSRSEAAHDTLH